MSNEELLEKLIHKPYLLRMGANKVSKQLKISKKQFQQARNLLRGRKPTKILILDIETSPLKAYIWSRWRQNVYLDQTISEWFMLCYAAKWLNSPNVISDKISTEEVLKEDDKRIVKSLWTLLDQADIVIAHNGKYFDIPKINSRFILHNLVPPSPYKVIDTKEVASKQFGFSSNKLDALATYFGIENKDKTDFELWKNCLEGKQEAIDYMSKYCNKDVIILEQVYLKLRPYIKNHPNINIYEDSGVLQCPNCGSKEVHSTNSLVVLRNQKYRAARCESCRAVSRFKISETLNTNKNNILISI